METPTRGKKFRALLATGRVANLPTVWSNVLVGFWLYAPIYSYYKKGPESSTFACVLALLTCSTASLLYLAGCMLGDWRDYHHDLTNRPERALPRGILNPGTVALIGFACLGTGLFLGCASTALAGIIAVVDDFSMLAEVFTSDEILITIQPHEILTTSILGTCIILYALWHKKSPKLALPLMAACRALLVLFAVSMAYKNFFSSSVISHWQIKTDWMHPSSLILAACVGFYTFLLSSVAASEARPETFAPRKTLGACMLLIPCGALYFAFQFLADLRHILSSAEVHFSYAYEKIEPHGHTGLTLSIFALYLLWTLFSLHKLKHSKPAFVSRSLAGFCLLDACFAAPFSPPLALTCIALFLLALLLQKAAPAT